LTMRKELLTSAAIIVASVAVAAAQSPDAKKQEQRPQAQSQQQNQNQSAQDKSGAANQQGQSNQAQSKQPSGSSGSSNQSASQPSSGSKDQAQNKDSAPSKTTGANTNDSNKSAADTNKSDNKAASDTSKPADNKAASDTSKPADNKAASDTKAPANNQPANAQNNRNNQQDNNRQNAQRDNNNDRNKAAANVKVTKEQTTKISAVIKKTNVRPVTNINFSLSVGVAVPASVTLTPIPADIVAIVPEYRGYDFFLANDEIVIVEPQTKKIVTVISSSTQAAEAPASGSREKLSFSKEQRETIRKHTRRSTTGSGSRSTTSVTVGERIPDNIELHEFSSDVYTTVPTVRTYRYIEAPRGIYLVDPQRRTVIEEIE
jgi:hypothetical protein